MQEKKFKIKWWQYLSIGAFVAGWIGNALAEKRDSADNVISAFGVITKDEVSDLVDGLLEQVAELTGIDEIKVI